MPAIRPHLEFTGAKPRCGLQDPNLANNNRWFPQPATARLGGEGPSFFCLEVEENP